MSIWSRIKDWFRVDPDYYPRGPGYGYPARTVVTMEDIKRMNLPKGPAMGAKREGQ